MEKFTPFKDACIIDNDIGTPFDRITFNSYFPMIFKTVKLLDYYKYFDFLFLSKERVIKNYDHMNALEYFDENPMVKTMIGPILGLEIDKLSVSGIFENLYHMMDGTKYYFTPNISQVTKEPTQEAVFSHWEKHLLNKHIPIHKNQALEDICIEDNKIKYVVLNSKKVYADEFIFACSLKPLNHILEKKPPCETFRNMKQLEQNLQLFFAFNIYFNKKIIMNCESFNLQEEPWQHTIQRKVNWPDDVIRKCKYDNKKVEEVWNVSIIDLVKGKKYKKTPRECSL